MAKNPVPIIEARQNYVNSAGTITARYQAGVGRADWQGPAGSDEAEDFWAQQVAAAAAARRRQQGVRSVSNESWRQAAITKGGAVIGTRVRESGDKWERGFRPYDAVIRETVGALPPRTADVNTNIDQRVKPLANALHDRKMAGG